MRNTLHWGYSDNSTSLPSSNRVKLLDYVEKHYPKYFEAPTKWEDPSLSSIERYSLEQKPAPVAVMGFATMRTASGGRPASRAPSASCGRTTRSR